MSYAVYYSKEARKDLKRLDYSIAQRVVKKVYFWSQQENPLRFAKRLVGLGSNFCRFRVGDYRIIFEIGEKRTIHVLFILAIKHRCEVYRV